MKIAIVGTGISGLVAAHLLHREHEISVYEANSYVGGHSHTVRVDTASGSYAIDTGFIAMNDRNYPRFSRLLERLGVPTQPTHMGFSVKGEHEDFEYAGTPRGIFCQPRNLRSPAFLRMLRELLRFNRLLRELLARGERDPRSLGEFVDEHGFSHMFINRLIVPQASAVWSADPRQMWSFPVHFMADFFANHGMLGFRDRPRWSTVAGGSVAYVDAITRPFRERIALDTPVRSLTRAADHVELVAAGHEPQRYDHVVIAAHSDQALAMLTDPSDAEAEILGAIPYQANEAVLHTDSTLLPRRRAARQAWNYHLLAEPRPMTTVTYYMNRLQRLDAEEDFCVTLNLGEAIDPARVIRRIRYAHPVYSARGVDAQRRHATISGSRRTHYCGAYWGWGFHEDGVVSALKALEPFGAAL